MRENIAGLTARMAELEKENERLENESLEVLQVLQRLHDKLVVDDSYGVHVSEFSSCTLCGAGGSPGAKFEHDESCAVLEAEQFLFNNEKPIKQSSDSE